MDFLARLDFNLLNAVQELRGDFFDGLMTILSLMGSWGLPWLAVAAVQLCRRGKRKQGLLILLSMAFGLILGSGILKHIIMRDRPFNNSLGLLTVNDLIIPPPSDRYSFPSGHAITSFAAAAAIFIQSKPMGVAAFVVAAAIAFSRVYLYVHFPLDVLAGALTGILCAVLARFVIDRVETFFKKRNLL